MDSLTFRGFPTNKQSEQWSKEHEQPGLVSERMNRDQRGPVLFQLGYHGGASEHGGKHDGCKPPSVIGMNVGTVPEKQLRELEISLESHTSKRGLPLVIATIHSGAHTRYSQSDDVTTIPDVKK